MVHFKITTYDNVINTNAFIMQLSCIIFASGYQIIISTTCVCAITSDLSIFRDAHIMVEMANNLENCWLLSENITLYSKERAIKF